MAEKKKAIIVYADWIDKFEELEDDEAGRLIKHFFRYVNDLNPEYPDRTTKLMFIDIKNTLKRDLDKWEDKSPERIEKARLAGLASAEARKAKKELNSTNELKNQLNPTKSTVSVSVSDTVSDTVSESVNVSESESESLKKEDNKSSVVISDELKIHPQGVKIDFIQLQKFFNDNRGIMPEVKKMTDARKVKIKNIENNIRAYNENRVVLASTILALKEYLKAIDLTNEKEKESIVTIKTLKDQPDPAENGIWTTGAGAWTRPSFANEESELVNLAAYVTSGTTNADSGWKISNLVSVIDVDPQDWVFISLNDERLREFLLRIISKCFVLFTLDNSQCVG